jgi:hypothetical protein
VVWVLEILGVGLWRFGRPSAAVLHNAIIAVRGGPDVLAITKDGETWIPDADAGLIEESSEPMVGTQGGGPRTSGRPDALVACQPASGDLLCRHWPSDDLECELRLERPVDPAYVRRAGGQRGRQDLYVASEYRDRVMRVNTAAGHAGPPVGTGLEPVATTASPDGGRLYVAKELGHDITVINSGTWRRAAVFSVAGWPGLIPDALAISPGGAWLYVADLARNAVLTPAAGCRSSAWPAGEQAQTAMTLLTYTSPSR